MITKSFAKRLCGFLFLFILVTNAASVALGNKIGEEDPVAKLLMINDNPNQFLISIVSALISHVSIIALIVMLYFVFSSYNKLLMVMATIFRLGEALIHIYNEINFLQLIDMAKEYADASYAEKIVLSASANVILQTKNLTFPLALALLAIGALAYCILFVTRKAIPTIIAWLGLTASALSVVGSGIKFVEPGFDILFKIGFPLMMLFEITFGGWLLFHSHKSARFRK
ncbi:MAG: DUF4386 domain-containing protein [Candidatus Bathyarchaeota archaeon]|nr:DUF4386 domain-containing protein [Candidatus Bathyarchaeota archaeon]